MAIVHIKLEQIGDDYFAYVKYAKKINPVYERQKWQMTKQNLRVWIKQLFPNSKKEVKGIKDYTLATNKGSRGVYVHYFLFQGIYEVNERISWRKSRLYFIKVEQNSYTEISEQEALWLTKNI